MKGPTVLAVLGVLALGMGPFSWADDQPEAAPGKLDIGGAVSADDRASTDASPQLTFEEYRLEVTADARPTDAARFHGEAWVRSAGLAPSSLASASALFSTTGTAPVSLDLREAYFELHGFLFDFVDLKVGRQRIAWGTADKLNPTDNVNALDLSDPWDFGRHLGSDGAQLTVYAGGVAITGLAVAQFTPAVLPTGPWQTALMPLDPATTSVTLAPLSLADRITAGVRVKANLLGYDVSVSYLYGRQSLPVADSVKIAATGMTADLVYPRQQVFGADLAGSLQGVGVWAEAALFRPSRVAMITDTTGIGGGVSTSTALASTPYVKYVVGGDYTFPGNVYVNAQFVHGLFQEAGSDALHDYLSAGLDWRVRDEKVKISPLNLMVEVGDWKDVPHNYAILAAPSVTFYPMDNAELAVGAHLVQATRSTLYGALNGQDEVFLHARYSF